MIFNHLVKVCLGVGLIVLGASGVALGDGILVNPQSTVNLSGYYLAYSGQNGYEGPILATDPDFTYSYYPDFNMYNASINETNEYQTAYSFSNHEFSCVSNYYPEVDVLNFILNFSLEGNATASWSIYSGWSNTMSGSLTSYFELAEWSNVAIGQNLAWDWNEYGDNATGSIFSNVMSIYGPLDDDFTNQTGFIFEKVLELPANWQNAPDAIYTTTLENLVAGTYLVEINSSIHSEGSGFDTTSSMGINTYNHASIELNEAIETALCLPGVPCPSAADVNGVGGVNLNDFAIWYDAPFDVTSDGNVNTSDEAAMAYLVGVPMIDSNGNGIVDALDDLATPVFPETISAQTVQLHPAFPNPFNPTTMLSFTLPSAGQVDLAVFDMKGKRIKTLLSAENRPEGLHEVSWNGRDDTGRITPAGVYFYRLGTESGQQTGRMVLLK